jgi:hypothetical protein
MAKRGHLQLLQLILERHQVQPWPNLDLTELHSIVCAGAARRGDEAMLRWAWRWLPPRRSKPYWATAL